MIKNRGLGKGLSALFAETDAEYDRTMDVDLGLPPVRETKQSEPKPSAPTAEAVREAEGGISEIPINRIAPNPNQPRKHFDEEKLRELADSIALHGVIQPVVLNKKGDRYIIIAGERRWRAAKLAGLEKMPAVVRELSDKEVKEISIIENLQREDLNPVEAALAIRELMDQFGLTQEQVAERIGKSRPAIANLLRLLTLSRQVLALVREGRLSAGHARALVVITDEMRQIELANRACDNKMSVRQLEEACRKQDDSARKPVKRNAKPAETQSRELKDLVSTMQTVFGTKVTVMGNDTKGRICIDYFSADDLDRIFDLMEEIR